MQKPGHTFSTLFEQLGLDDTDEAIASFIQTNSPLPRGVELHEAAFWSPAQAEFLHQAKVDDADWAELVDQLNVALREEATPA